jgi:hypothetical protein
VNRNDIGFAAESVKIDTVVSIVERSLEGYYTATEGICYRRNFFSNVSKTYYTPCFTFYLIIRLV